ncbi:MAG: hypothetical protein CW338_06410, partial [Clostridiales bacterium]|nr:hypothetical protein [Clostridiales bacterium]
AAAFGHRPAGSQILTDTARLVEMIPIFHDRTTFSFRISGRIYLPKYIIYEIGRDEKDISANPRRRFPADIFTLTKAGATDIM